MRELNIEIFIDTPAMYSVLSHHYLQLTGYTRRAFKFPWILREPGVIDVIQATLCLETFENCINYRRLMAYDILT